MKVQIYEFDFEDYFIPYGNKEIEELAKKILSVLHRNSRWNISSTCIQEDLDYIFGMNCETDDLI